MRLLNFQAEMATYKRRGYKPKKDKVEKGVDKEASHARKKLPVAGQLLRSGVRQVGNAECWQEEYSGAR